jgi:hypothetical protein
MIEENPEASMRNEFEVKNTKKELWTGCGVFQRVTQKRALRCP